MKALLVIETEALATLVNRTIKPLGFETILYENPLKAIDNIDEVDPDAIIISARDFPRHWKPLVQIVRESRDKEKCVFVVLKNDSFSFDEAAKAIFLGVNGVVKEDISEPAELERFQQLLKRYKAIDDPRNCKRFGISPSDRIDFIFAFPGSLQIMTGRVHTISQTGLSFLPDNSSLASGLEVGDVLYDCSLRIGEEILSPRCRLVRNNKLLGLEYVSLSDENAATISNYLRSSTERELREVAKRIPANAT